MEEEFNLRAENSKELALKEKLDLNDDVNWSIKEVETDLSNNSFRIRLFRNKRPSSSELKSL